MRMAKATICPIFEGLCGFIFDFLEICSGFMVLQPIFLS